MWIRVGEGQEQEWLRAERLDERHARVLDLPSAAGVNVFDVVRYDPASAEVAAQGPSYRFDGVVTPSGYRAYLAWAVLHQPTRFAVWRETMTEAGIQVREGAWVASGVRQMIIAVPPQLSALEALVRFNRRAPTVELICPLLAAHADDLERAKSDLERAVAWGGPDAELTFALAEAFEAQKRWDEAVTFWERLAHALPTSGAAHEHLALCYAQLGVYPLAANAFDRAADLAEEAAHRQRLLAARELMWERSRV